GGRGDADGSAADLGDRLAGADVRADGLEGRGGGPLVNVGGRVGTAIDEQDRRGAAEAVEALLDDRPAGDRELDQVPAALVGVTAEIDALVQRPPAPRGHM